MPTYTYKCSKCGAEFDRIRNISQRHDPCDCNGCNEKECCQMIITSKSAADIVSGVGEDRKLPSWFKDKSNALAKTFKNSKMKTY